MQKWRLVLARPIEVYADSFNDAVAEVYDNPSFFLELQGLIENEKTDYDAMTMPSADQAVANGKQLMAERRWHGLGYLVIQGLTVSGEFDSNDKMRQESKESMTDALRCLGATEDEITKLYEQEGWK